MTKIITTVSSLKELDVTLDKLYKNDYQINVHLSDKDFTFYVILLSVNDKIDCKLSSYRANMWMRTTAGVEYRKYSRIQDLQTAIVKTIKSKVDSQGEIRFSLSKHIGYM